MKTQNSLNVDKFEKAFSGNFTLENVPLKGMTLTGNFEDVPEITIEKLEAMGYIIVRTDCNGYTPEQLQAMWNTAIEAFPYPLDPTSIEQGDPPEDADLDDDIEYSVEYTFDAGDLLSLNVMAGGWIEFRYDRRYDDKPTIYGWFGLALGGDWHNPQAKIGGEYDMAQTWYDIDTEEWSEITIEPI